MENKANVRCDDLDPVADLALLDQVKRNVERHDLMNFGPWWYAPVLATMAASLTLFNRGAEFAWEIAYLVVAAGMLVLSVGHHYLRRNVRTRFSREGFGAMLVVAALCWLVTVAWGVAVSTLGYDAFVPGYAILAWFLTVGYFLAIRQVLLRVSARRIPFT